MHNITQTKYFQTLHWQHHYLLAWLQMITCKICKRCLKDLRNAILNCIQANVGSHRSCKWIGVQKVKVEVITCVCRPLDVSWLWVFLCLCNYCWRFIKGFNKIIKPLRLLMKNDQKYIWGDTKKIGHSRVESFVHFNFYFMLICMEITLLVTHCLEYFRVGSCVHTIELLQLKIHHGIYQSIQ